MPPTSANSARRPSSIPTCCTAGADVRATISGRRRCGTRSGRAVVDQCAVATKYNQVNANTNVAVGPDPRGCRSVDPFQTQVRGLATYIIPKVDVLVSAAIRSQPPVTLGATNQTTAQW